MENPTQVTRDTDTSWYEVNGFEVPSSPQDYEEPPIDTPETPAIPRSDTSRPPSDGSVFDYDNYNNDAQPGKSPYNFDI